MAVTRVSFVAGSRVARAGAAVSEAADAAEWAIEKIVAIKGEALAPAPLLCRIEGAELVTPSPAEALWSLHGVRSNERYSERAEKDRLVAAQPGLGRPDSRAGALIPLRKNQAWWDLAQDERRALFETRSHHIEIGAAYLPAIARRLYHCRDIGGPFDFLTWFEFNPRDAPAFDELLGRLRETEEWRFVDREVEIRVRLG